MFFFNLVHPEAIDLNSFYQNIGVGGTRESSFHFFGHISSQVCSSHTAKKGMSIQFHWLTLDRSLCDNDNVIYDVTLTSFIVRVLHHFTSWCKPVIYVCIKVICIAIHNSVHITILIPTPFLKNCGSGVSCFLYSLVSKKDGLDHPWFLSSHGDCLGVISSNFLVLWSTRRSQTRE